MNDPSDKALVHSAGAGDMDALGALYARHHQQVYELCYRIVGDPDVAEDLTHEGFLRVLRYGSGFDDRSSVASWLYRLIRNRCLDFLATRDREQAGREAWRVQLETEQGDTDVDTDRQALVRKALGQLRPEMREVLVLSRFGGMKYREIAEVCEISLANVKVRAHRAMNELRRVLQELEQGHEL